MISPTSTRDQIVALAQKLIQTQGSNGFSYRDLAAKIGIKTSSIHYHFPQKEDLLLAAVEDYHQRWHVAIRAIDPQLPADEQLRQYIAMQHSACRDSGSVCLAGALAADVGSLPPAVREALQGFYRSNEDWLEGLLRQGQDDHALRCPKDAKAGGRALFAAIQGSLLAARLFHNEARTQDVVAGMVNDLVKQLPGVHPARQPGLQPEPTP